ncbi:MAG: hypothetical protein AAF497_05055, partial [Planctomycetota bacterium]
MTIEPGRAGANTFDLPCGLQRLDWQFHECRKRVERFDPFDDLRCHPIVVIPKKCFFFAVDPVQLSMQLPGSHSQVTVILSLTFVDVTIVSILQSVLSLREMSLASVMAMICRDEWNSG